MATTERDDGPTNDSAPPPSEFELRRADLVAEIGDSLEQVLAQINTLNRSLEGIIEIGNEFSSVEALWSQFENVMGRDDAEVSVPREQRQEQGQEQGPEQNGNDKVQAEVADDDGA